MSATITTRGRPSSVEMFKQRHQAYAVANEARVYFGAARAAYRTTDFDQAGFYAGEVVAAAEANPQARKMLGEETIEEARTISTESNKRLAAAFGSASEREVVETIRQGSWTQSESVETRLSFGRSDKGYHYSLDVSGQNFDRDGHWSKAYRTLQGAEKAGGAREGMEHGWFERTTQQRPPTARQEHTRALDEAGKLRLRAGAEGSSTPTPERKADLIAHAKSEVAKAASLRTYGQAVTQAMRQNVLPVQNASGWELLKQRGQQVQQQQQQASNSSPDVAAKAAHKPRLS